MCEKTSSITNMIVFSIARNMFLNNCYKEAKNSNTYEESNYYQISFSDF